MSLDKKPLLSRKKPDRRIYCKFCGGILRHDGEVRAAIKTLLRTHMKIDRNDIPLIIMGATPPEWDHRRYGEAWLLLWEKFGPQSDRQLKEGK